MAENPLVHVPGAWPVLQRVNALRRTAVGRLRSFDMLQWDEVPYGPHPRQRMHIWELNDLAPREGWPTVLLIHGGGWVEGSWRDFESLAPMFSRRGVMAAAMSYRLAPDDPWPAALEDVSLALDFLRSQQVDPERISAWGHSAGGHLALMAGNQPDHGLRCLVALGAPTDLVRLDREGPDSMAPVFQEQCLEAASPLHASTRPESPLPPTLLVHGSMDRVCDVEHARALLKARPDRVELREVAQGDHGLRWPIPEALIARRKALQWLVEQMDLQSRGSKWKIRRRRNR